MVIADEAIVVSFDLLQYRTRRNSRALLLPDQRGNCMTLRSAGYNRQLDALLLCSEVT